MNKVKVFNANVHPLVEIFKGDTVTIEPKDYWRNKDGSIKEMDIFEASEFKGQYHPGPIDTDGKIIHDSKYFKMIQLEPVASQKPEAPAEKGHKCMHPGCRHVSPSTEELEAHNKVRHPNALAGSALDGPVNADPSAVHTRPEFRQNEASQGKEDAPSTKRKTG